MNAAYILLYLSCSVYSASVMRVNGVICNGSNKLCTATDSSSSPNLPETTASNKTQLLQPVGDGEGGLVFSSNMSRFTPSDEALKDGGKGETVVNEVIGYAEAILSETKEFMIKIALVESNFGNDRSTYRTGYNGGIFQVDEVGFLTTQDVQSHPGLKSKFRKIQAALNIDWNTVSWSDLRKPLFCALAARLFLSNIPVPIPGDLHGQAEYWKKYYNSSSGKGTVQDFIKRWNDFIHGRKNPRSS